MEPETHRLDREAMHAGHLEVALRVQRETDEIVAAADAKRRAYDEWQFQPMHAGAAAEAKRLAILVGTDASPGLTEERLRAALQRSAACIAAIPGQPRADGAGGRHQRADDAVDVRVVLGRRRA